MEIRGGNKFLSPGMLLAQAGLMEGKKIGYLGCGSSGIFTIPFARAAGPTGIVYAVDVVQGALDSTMREVRRNNLKNVVPVMANVESANGVSIAPASLDIVFMINVLFQNSNRAAMIKEAVRLLKKNGKLIVVDWSQDELSIGPAFDRRISPEDVDMLATEAGMTRFASSRIGDFHFVSIFKKVK